MRSIFFSTAKTWFKKHKEPVVETFSLQARERAYFDVHSGTWAFIEELLQEKLDKARKANDSLAKDADQTAALRGRIAVLKELLDLPKPPPTRKSPVHSEETNDEY